MLAADGRMMLGTSALATLRSDKQLSKNATCIGTPAYLSPEMLRRLGEPRREHGDGPCGWTSGGCGLSL